MIKKNGDHSLSETLQVRFCCSVGCHINVCCLHCVVKVGIICAYKLWHASNCQLCWKGHLLYYFTSIFKTSKSKIGMFFWCNLYLPHYTSSVLDLKLKFGYFSAAIRTYYLPNYKLHYIITKHGCKHHNGLFIVLTSTTIT